MKKIRRLLTGLVLLFSLASSFPATLAQSPNGTLLQGVWEGEIVGSRRPYRLRLEVAPDDSQDPIQVTVDGRFSLPVGDIRRADQRLQFVSNLNGQDLNFELAVRGEDLTGSVLAGDRSLTIVLWKSRAYPVPANREEAWLQDFDSLEQRFIRFDRSFNESEKVVFRQRLAELGSQVHSLGDSEIVVRPSELVASAENAHTRLYLLRNRTELRRLPIRVNWFREGAFVVRATAAYKALLGCRVVEIEGRELSLVFDQVNRLFAGNASWKLYKSPYFLTSPEILDGLDVADNPEVVRHTLECDDRERAVALSPLPLEQKKESTEAWKDLSAQPSKNWFSLLGADALPPQPTAPAVTQ